MESVNLDNVVILINLPDLRSQALGEDHWSGESSISPEITLERLFRVILAGVGELRDFQLVASPSIAPGRG